MRISRFFSKSPLRLGQHKLDEAQSHYMIRVLRMMEKSRLQMFDGSGSEFIGLIDVINNNRVFILLEKEIPGKPRSPLFIHLAQSISNNERMKWTVQKATELGCDEITPIISRRSEKLKNKQWVNKRLDYWSKVIISASEQCGRSKLPILNTPLKLEEWIVNIDVDLKILLHPSTKGEKLIGSTPRKVALLVGPEGGFSPEEVLRAQNCQFKSLKLGPRILRTETSSLAAISILQSLWGDL